jgi:hypothetical protein
MTAGMRLHAKRDADEPAFGIWAGSDSSLTARELVDARTQAGG